MDDADVMSRRVVFVLPLALLGCRHRAASLDRPAEPVATQIVRAAPEIKGNHFRPLLDFENASDLVFVDTSQSGNKPALDPAAHTGRNALIVVDGTLRVRVSPLLYGAKLPGAWTLIGLYVRGETTGLAELACVVNGERVSVGEQLFAPGVWTLATVDLAATPQLVERLSRLSGDDKLTLECRFAGGGAVRVDDVLLLDNTARLVGTADHLSGWTVARRGNSILIDAPGRFNLRLDATGPNAWTLEEANDLRARFRSAGGPARVLTVYVDGRSFWDGAFKNLAGRDSPGAGLLDEIKTSLPTLNVAAPGGRLDRNAPGDKANDGFDESRGTFRVTANGPRVDLTITPAGGSAVTWPTLEIAGLPSGSVTATVDGRLVERVTRLDDGTVLIKLPLRFEGPASFQVRVR